MIQRSKLLSVVGALVVACFLAQSAQAAPSDFGVEAFSASVSTNQAGAHPDFTTSFKMNTDSGGHPFATVKEIAIDLPPGFTGNPMAAPKCTPAQLTNGVRISEIEEESSCPVVTQVGTTEVVVNLLGGAGFGTFLEPVYNMTTPGGDTVARLGFIAEFFPTIIEVKLDPERDYGLTAHLKGLAGLAEIISAKTILWGDPSATIHDPDRITPYEANFCGGEPCTAPGKQPRQSNLPPIPFMTNPTSCQGALPLAIHATSYAEPERTASLDTAVQGMTNCESAPFQPQVSLAPTSTEADSPTGMDASITVPQPGLEHPNVTASANLKRAIVTLPEGLSLNPSAAAGLGGCSEAQIGLVAETPTPRFNDAPPACPASSKVGTAEIHTPLLPEPIQGSLYVAAQGDNPFHALLAGYLVAQGQGVLLKVPGRFELDPSTGRITAVFDDNPQQPFDSLTLRFNAGPRGVLTTPRSCGSYAIESELAPWSATDPESPRADEVRNSINSFSILSGPAGGACPAPSQFGPSLEAGTTNPIAGIYSPFVLRLAREDGSQRLSGVSVSLPPGLVGKLAGIPYCPDAVLANIPEALGAGIGQLGSPSCPVASEVGTASVGAGSGPTPLYVSTGRAYLAGPYKGAPLSLAIVTPAVAGPFDLGSVVVRVALWVDSETTRITAVSDPIPTALHGVQLDLRDVRVSLGREGFTLNPTSCEAMGFAGTATSASGVVAPLAERFQVGSCERLAFRPKLSLRVDGGTRRAAHPRLKAVLEARRGQANIARLQVALPHSEFLDQGNIRTICTRVQFAARACPPGSVYGHVRATSPLLGYAVEGPVYLRSSRHLLPDLVAVVRGPSSQPIEVAAVGRIDSVQGGLRATFEAFPDVPVSKVTLTMAGGKKGLLENSTNLCRSTNRAAVKLDAQNGRRHDFTTAVANSCGKR